MKSEDSWLSATGEHAAPSHSAPDDRQGHPGPNTGPGEQRKKGSYLKKTLKSHNT